MCRLSASKGLSFLLLYNMVTHSDDLIAQFEGCDLDKAVAKDGLLFLNRNMDGTSFNENTT